MTLLLNSTASAEKAQFMPYTQYSASFLAQLTIGQALLIKNAQFIHSSDSVAEFSSNDCR
jgi:hypothetical protein